jgi:hypothetical protein
LTTPPDKTNGIPKLPAGWITLKECAKYLTKKFAQKFTPEELKEWCEAGYMPHTKIKGKGISCRASKVAAWVKEQFFDTCEGELFNYKVKKIYLRGENLPVNIPLELLDLADNLLYFPYRNHTFPPCIYFLVHNQKVVYVGQTVSLMGRLKSHAQYKEFEDVYFLPVPRSKLDEVEVAFIRTMAPKYNGTYNDNSPSDNDYEIVNALKQKKND